MLETDRQKDNRVEMSTRTQVDVRRVRGTVGLPGYLVFITMGVSYAAK